jgi:PAS domain S-box-containing protein
MSLQNTPIKRKLMVILMVTSGVVLLLTCGTFVGYELLTFKERTYQSLSTLGEVIASSSAASLAFDNKGDATAALTALRARPQIVAAALYDRTGKLFARYPATLPADSFRASPESDGFRDEHSRLIAYLPVVQGGDNIRLGTLYLASTKKATYDRLVRYTWLAAGVLVVSLAVAYLLSAMLQGHISRPLLAMAETAQAVSKGGDYSVRATKSGDDELGLLTDAFNGMLEQIETQNRTILESHDRLNLALKASGVGTWSLDIAENRISLDEFANPLFGYPAGAYDAEFDLFLTLIHRADRARVEKEMHDVAAAGGSYESSFRVVWPDGTVRDLSGRGKVIRGARALSRMTGVFWDITERKRTEARLNRLLVELERSNKELELFAYVASHDLQEPLRMVSSYTQLLERRYSDKLDDDAREFIGYAVDGANRMQRLINDLLEFSRVNTRGKSLERTDVAEILDTVRLNLSVAIEETGALVTNDFMPVVPADGGQLGQLLQNLVANGIKFRNGGHPRVHVGAVESEHQWEFSVRDNGIGIEQQYFDRIFVIFQRLHTKGDFPGTGIGLALCKRIAERHGGRIWLESKPKEGSTFFFTIPKLAHSGTT